MNHPGFFDFEERLASLSKSSDPLEVLLPTFGYKNHINIDNRHGLIRTWRIAHDGACFP